MRRRPCVPDRADATEPNAFPQVRAGTNRRPLIAGAANPERFIARGAGELRRLGRCGEGPVAPVQEKRPPPASRGAEWRPQRGVGPRTTQCTAGGSAARFGMHRQTLILSMVSVRSFDGPPTTCSPWTQVLVDAITSESSETDVTTAVLKVGDWPSLTKTHARARDLRSPEHPS